MTGRSPARLLAPLALVITAVALFAVVNSGGGSDNSKRDEGGPAGAGTSATATATKTAKQPKTRTYTVKPGDTPSAIAQKLDITVAELMDANPRADANSLQPGQKLKLP